MAGLAGENVLAQSGQGNVDVQPNGPGNNWKYLSGCASLDGPSVPTGDFEERWCQDPLSAGGFKVSSTIRTAPDWASGTLTTKLGKINFLKGLSCPFGIRARYADCPPREDPANYKYLMLNYSPANITEHSYGNDLVVTDPANVDEIMVPAPWKAISEYLTQKIAPFRMGSLAELGDQQINDIEICDTGSCSPSCGVPSEGCAKFFAVTNVDVAPYGNPNLIYGYLEDGVWHIAAYPILSLSGNATAVECAGSRVVVVSGTSVAYSDTPTDPDSWTVVTLAYTASTYSHGLHMRTSREGYVVCNGGYTYKTTDAAQTWTLVPTNTWTAANLYSVYAYDENLVYVGGVNGTLLRSETGGRSWIDITDVATYGNVSIISLRVPPGRPDELYLGTTNGKVWRSKNKGADFTQVHFPNEGAGTVDDLDFAGPNNGENLFVLHNDAGPRARIWRDLSGGAGGPDMELIMDQTAVIGAGINLKALAACKDPNYALAGGALYGGFPVLIEMTT